MAKRANGEGSVRQRPDGKWEARISYRDDAGRLVRRSFYASTQREARAKAKTATRRLERSLPVVDARTTLSAWADQWERTTLEASDRKPATKALYRTLARVHRP